MIMSVESVVSVNMTNNFGHFGQWDSGIQSIDRAAAWGRVALGVCAAGNDDCRCRVWCGGLVGMNCTVSSPCGSVSEIMGW